MVDIQSLPEDVQVYIRGLRDEAAGYRVERNEWQAKAQEAESNLTQATEKVHTLTAENTTLKGNVQATTRDKWLSEVRDDDRFKHLPPSVINLLPGDTKEAILQAAENVAKDVPANTRPKPPADQTVTQPENKGDHGSGTLDESARSLGDKLREMRGLGGTAD